MLACQLAASHLFYASLEEVFRGDLYQKDHVFLKLRPRLPLPGVLPIDLHMLVVLFGSASTDWEIKNLVLVRWCYLQRDFVRMLQKRNIFEI